MCPFLLMYQNDQTCSRYHSDCLVLSSIVLPLRLLCWKYMCTLSICPSNTRDFKKSFLRTAFYYPSHPEASSILPSNSVLHLLISPNTPSLPFRLLPSLIRESLHSQASWILSCTPATRSCSSELLQKMASTTPNNSQIFHHQPTPPKTTCPIPKTRTKTKTHPQSL
jgi:hypothetical protein